jgi:hypothetical protein
LSTIERLQLGVERSQADVPGAEIPGMHLDYLRPGDAGSMERVMYHNEIDILSLVGLSVGIFARYEQENPHELRDAEALAIARWHQDAGRPDQAEAAYQAAIQSDDLELRLAALRRYTSHLKRAGKREQALEAWMLWQRLRPDEPEPCVELAKYYEWHARDLDEANRWAEQALLSLTHWPEGWQRDRAWKAVEHRIKRLVRKLDS